MLSDKCPVIVATISVVRAHYLNGKSSDRVVVTLTPVVDTSFKLLLIILQNPTVAGKLPTVFCFFLAMCHSWERITSFAPWVTQGLELHSFIARKMPRSMHNMRPYIGNYVNCLKRIIL